jgi:hypothetical protein
MFLWTVLPIVPAPRTETKRPPTTNAAPDTTPVPRTVQARS